nr:transcriptional regulator FtrA [uncultured Pseudomonas sp.]
MPDFPGLVALLAYDGLCTFEFGIAVEIFALPRPEFEFPWYRHVVVAIDPGPMRALGGLAVTADAGLEALGQAHTIIVPGWRNRVEPPPRALLDELRKAHARGARLLSICSGAFVLAAAGLLDGKRATSHWRYCDELAARFPAIDVDATVLYVDSGQILTSAGSAAGIDACLHLVERDFGAHVSNMVARRLVMAPLRAGGQAQFIASPVAQTSRHDLATVLDWAREHLGQPLTIRQMAAKALMSERTFLRRFREATGMTPKSWLQRSRIAQARSLLESSGLNTEQIAARCGFASVETFRVAFRKNVGLAPSLYRDSFGR